MSFFKELKEDIAQSVNELTESLDEGLSAEVETGADDMVEKTMVPEEEPLVSKNMEEDMLTTSNAPSEDGFGDLPEDEVMTADRARALLAGLDGTAEENPVTESVEPDTEEGQDPEETVPQEPVLEDVALEEPVSEETEADRENPEDVMETENSDPKEENIVSEENEIEVTDMEDVNPEEVTVITKGTTINGGIKSDTSLIVKGTIEGDVECQGKLTITGRVAGNTIASEIYVNTPRLEGDINSKGIVKIDVGTVVIGNVNCTSVVVAGAVKGNIEVNGPVVVDTTAVVKGDISAKSIQINSGAVIDGHCSLQFADVDLDTFFE